MMTAEEVLGEEEIGASCEEASEWDHLWPGGPEVAETLVALMGT